MRFVSFVRHIHFVYPTHWHIACECCRTNEPATQMQIQVMLLVEAVQHQTNWMRSWTKEKKSTHTHTQQQMEENNKNSKHKGKEQTETLNLLLLLWIYLWIVAPQLVFFGWQVAYFHNFATWRIFIEGVRKLIPQFGHWFLHFNFGNQFDFNSN